MAEGETTQVTFQYIATDQGGATSNAATGTITVTGVNDAPTVAAIAANAQEDGLPIILEAAGDDVDGDDDVASLTYVITSTLPRGAGAVTDNGDGKFSYDPVVISRSWPRAKPSEVAFAFPSSTATTRPRTITLAKVTVVGVNDAPTATDLAFATSEDGPILPQTRRAMTLTATTMPRASPM